jgi:phosphocarrier protein
MPSLRCEVQITNLLGLHLRAADKFVALTRQFQAEVRVLCNGRAANGGSILDLLCLAAECGACLELELAGPEAKDAAVALCELVTSRFHETESVRDRLPHARYS